MKTPIPCEYVSWTKGSGLARKLALAVRDSGFDPDVVIGVARGGWPAARIVSDWLGRPNLLSIRLERYSGVDKAEGVKVRHGLQEDLGGKRVLIVDDVNDTGATLAAAKAYVMTHSRPAEVRVGVLHHKITARFKPDYAVRRVVKWRWILYPWSVIESLASLLGKMDNRPKTPEEIRTRLAKDHKANVPLNEVAEALAMLDGGRGWGGSKS